MKVIIAGSTGMVGNLVLNNCLHSDKIAEVRSLVRKPTGLKHQKLKELLLKTSKTILGTRIYSRILMLHILSRSLYRSSPDEEFNKITVNYSVEFAMALKKRKSQATLCLLSGAGADRTEKSKTSFARYKSMARIRSSD